KGPVHAGMTITLEGTLNCSTVQPFNTLAMPHWIRIFGTNDWTPRATQLVEQLDSLGFDVTTEVMGEEDEWEQVSLETAGMETPVMLERTPPDDPEIDEEVDPLLEWLESVDDVFDVEEIERVLRHTMQLFILGMPIGMHSAPY